MKKSTDLLLDLKTCWFYLRKKKAAMTFVNCHYCKSIYIKFTNGKENGNTYASTYSCTKCGATCSNTEEWTPGESK